MDELKLKKNVVISYLASDEQPARKGEGGVVGQEGFGKNRNSDKRLQEERRVEDFESSAEELRFNTVMKFTA